MTEHDDAYQEWLQWLRQRLRREPTEADIKLAATLRRHGGHGPDVPERS
jgi:hypothetical protein